jgi:queuine tRNA-ribosyltransferase
MFDFRLDAQEGAARAGTFTTPRGAVSTPAFMPVGTAGTVKALAPEEVEALGARIVLANTYHLYLRPGHELVRELGGLHAFMRWKGPLLTDSGGFQVFSLAAIRDVHDDGVDFRSHIDGSVHTFTPESVIDVQRALGADVIMAFDECPPGGCDRATAEAANERTLAWLARCRDRFDQLGAQGGVPPQALFPVLQGNVFDDLRRAHARRTRELGDWAGYGIGGLSVGEAKGDMWRTLELLDGEVPAGRPRYLMGVGYPDDLLEAIARGCDLFDCVAPTRNARHGTAWTATEGQVNLKAARFRRDTGPIDVGCDCYACARFDRAYLRHLVVAGEWLAMRLVSIHNLRFLVRLAEEARRRIGEGTFGTWHRDWLERYRNEGSTQ